MSLELGKIGNVELAEPWIRKVNKQYEKQEN